MTHMYRPGGLGIYSVDTGALDRPAHSIAPGNVLTLSAEANGGGLGCAMGCGGLGAFDVASFAGGSGLILAGLAAFVGYVLLQGSPAKVRRSKLREEDQRHRQTVAEIKRRYTRLGERA